MKSFFRSCWVPTVSVLLASVVLVAFGSNTPGSVAGASSAEARAPHRGGTLTIAIGTNPSTLNHDQATSIPASALIQRLYDNMLFVANGKEELVPSLATSYTESKNGLTYTIDLRHGVLWSDGVPFTSKDVVFTFEKWLQFIPKVPAALLSDLTHVKAVGTYQVVIHLKHPYAPFVVEFTSTLFIMPAHVYGNQTVVQDSAANEHPIGTGPYIVKQWIQTQKIVLVRNPHYWGATKKDPLPWFNEVVVDIITNPQTIVDDLLSGVIDYVPTTYLPVSSVKELEHSSCCRAVAIHTTPTANIMYTNTARPPFNNLTVRRAVYMAITRKAVIQDALSGYGTLPLAPISPAFAKLYTPKINLMKQYPFDPTKAAKMLDEAGYPVKNGERFGKALTLLYPSSTDPVAINIADIVRANLAKITIKVNLVGEDFTTWATESYVKKAFTLSLIPGIPSENDPALGIQRLFACQPLRTGKPAEFTNASGFCNKEVTSLFDQAAVALTTAGRQRAYAKVQKILDDDLPSYELGWRNTFVGVSKRVQNWQISLLSWGGSFNTTWSESWFK